MSDETRLVPRGLVTDPSQLVAGDGGLVRANNVQFRRAGLIEPRGALQGTISSNARTNGYTTTTYARSWKGVTWFAATNSTDARVYSSANLATPTFTVTSTAGAYVRAEQYDGTQVWTFSPALRCIDHYLSNGGGTTPFQRLPGAPRGVLLNLQPGIGTTPSIAANSATAYRIVFVRKIDTSNGEGTSFRTIYGAPSDRYTFVNDLAATTQSAQLTIPVGTVGLQANDEVQVYRCALSVAGSTNDPGDEMRLRYTHKVTSADATAGSVVWTDGLLDGAWNGPSLYTNASEEGPLRANYRVRNANDAALYAGKMFYAGASAGYRQSVNLKSLGQSTTAPLETFCSILTGNVTRTTGSAVLTAVPANVFPYLSVGAIVSGSSAIGASDPTASTLGIRGAVVSWNAGASTVTLDTAATSTVTGPIVIWDWIAISQPSPGSPKAFPIYASWVDISGGGATYQSMSNVASVVDVTNTVTPAGAQAKGNFGGSAIERTFVNAYPWASNVTNGRAFRLYSDIGTNKSTGIQITVEYDATVDSSGGCDIAGARQFSIISNKVNAFDVELATTFASSGGAKAALFGGVAHLWWSKLYEYESIPIGNQGSIVLGDPSEPIVRIFATSDRLFVLKTDGLWAVYGDGDTPESLQANQVDPTLRMIWSSSVNLSNLAAKIGNEIFAWTRNGIVKVNASGIQPIDAAIANDIRAITPGPMGTSGETPPFVAFAAASVRDGLVHFATKPTSNLFAWYVYNIRTDTWATWSAFEQLGLPSAGVASITGSGATDDGSLVLGMSGGGFAQYLEWPIYNSSATSPSNTPPYTCDFYTVPADAGYPYSITVFGGNQVTFTGGTPRVGDAFVDGGGTFWRIVSNNSGRYQLDRSGTATAGALQAFYYGHDRTVTFAATTQQAPHVEKFLRECFVSFQQLRGGTQFVYTWRGRGKTASTTHVVVYDTYAQFGLTPTFMTDQEYWKNISVPSSISRDTGLQTSINFSEARIYYALDALVLAIDPTTTRVGGRR